MTLIYKKQFMWPFDVWLYKSLCPSPEAENHQLQPWTNLYRAIDYEAPMTGITWNFDLRVTDFIRTVEIIFWGVAITASVACVCVRLHRVHDLARDKMYNPHTALKARVIIICPHKKPEWRLEPVLDSPKDLTVVGSHSSWLQGFDVSLSAKRRTNSPINDLVVARRSYNHPKVVRIKSCIGRNPVAMRLSGWHMLGSHSGTHTFPASLQKRPIIPNGCPFEA